MARTPIALLTYNRPRHTARLLTALSRCTGLDRCALTIYCDAPKSAAQAEAVEGNRAIARDWASRLDASLVERQENLGLARSIVGAVSRHVSSAGRVIVLEDDLVPTPDFLEFMLAGLETYADNTEVAQISGCLLPDEFPARHDGLFLPLTTTWGWATWGRAWSDFRWDVDAAELDDDPAFRGRFTLDGTVDYVSMLRNRVTGGNDSWGILWWFAVARANKLVLYPRESLIWNGGFDNSGVHCGGTEEFQPDPPVRFRSPRLGERQIRLPLAAEADSEALAAVRRHLGGSPEIQLKPRGPIANWIGRLRRRG